MSEAEAGRGDLRSSSSAILKPEVLMGAERRNCGGAGIEGDQRAVAKGFVGATRKDVPAPW